MLFATHYFELTQLAHRYPQAVNRHLAAAEHRGTIAFLHEVRDGPANRSYGLQVARLAGLPAPVVRAAGQLLEALEARARDDDGQIDLFAAGGAGEAESMPLEGHAATAQSGQLGGASGVESPDDARASDVLSRLAAIDPDQLSARAALELLYELHAQLRG